MQQKFSREEKFIINQSPEIIQGENPRWPNKLLSAFPAFSNKNYRLYFFGQLVSMIGTWLQIVAQGWLVLKLTNSPFILGLVTALSTLPTLLFTLLGGVIVDRFSKKDILIFTQIGAMILALVLGGLTILNMINLWIIGILAFLLGTVNSVDAPARQAFVSDMVDKEQLPSAIALNSGVFNAARAIGPAIAGILIAAFGTGSAFIINGLSYGAVIAALISMRITGYIPDHKVHPITAIKDGLSYAGNHPVIRNLLIFAGMISIFGWSYTTLLPFIAKHEYGLNAQGLGFFYTAGGLGSLLAAFIVAGFSKKISSATFIFGGNILFTTSLLLFTLTTDFKLSLVCLFLAGMGLVSQASTINSTLQNLVNPDYRGRVMSIYVLMFIGLIPIGNLQIGYVSEHFGTSFAIQLGAGILLIFGLLLMAYQKKIRDKFDIYKIKDEQHRRPH